jgi:hypothetical protein
VPILGGAGQTSILFLLFQVTRWSLQEGVFDLHKLAQQQDQVKMYIAHTTALEDGANSPKTHTITQAPTAYCVRNALLVLSGDQADVRC